MWLFLCTPPQQTITGCPLGSPEVALSDAPQHSAFCTRCKGVPADSFCLDLVHPIKWGVNQLLIPPGFQQ